MNFHILLFVYFFSSYFIDFKMLEVTPMFELVPHLRSILFEGDKVLFFTINLQNRRDNYREPCMTYMLIYKRNNIYCW